MEYLVQQYLLHSAPYKETSALMTGLSKELGKIRFVAKGIRSEKNKYKGLAQTFTLLSTKLIGKGELKSGVAMEAMQNTVPLAGTALYCGMYCNEVLVRVLPLEEPCPEVFETYELVLQNLAKGSAPEPILRSFELYLLQELGATYDFLTDYSTDQPIEPELYYQFALEQGFYFANQMRTHQAFKGRDLIAIADQNWDLDSLKAAKRFCRMALAPWIGKKPLKSRELFARHS